MTSSAPFIGRSVKRVEDRRFLRGRGTFSDDLRAADQLHAAVLRSPVAHGIVRAIDPTEALALPGVHAVITAADFGSNVPRIPIRLFPMPELTAFERPVIAADKVRFTGEPVAVILADSPASAEDGRDAVRLDVEALAPVVDGGAGMAARALPFEADGANVAVVYTGRDGDAEAAFAAADYTRRERFTVHRQAAVPMEPRGLLAEWDAAAGRLRVQGAAKVPFANRAVLSGLIGLPESAVELVEVDVGGGFGARGEFTHEDFLIPFAARLTGRPVKWTEDRRDHMMTSSHARDVVCEIEIACTREGAITGLRGRAVCDVGAYITAAGVIPARNVAMFLAGPYRIPDYHVTCAVVLTNKTPSGPYRGPGRFEVDFFRERMLDLAAGDLGIDRVAFRRRNLVSADAMPHALPAVSPAPAASALDSGDYRGTLDRCLAEIGWEEKKALQGALIDGRYHGLGIGCFVEGGAAGPKETARLRLEPDGTLALFVGSAALGQGLETVCAQIAADEIGLPMDRITVHHGSTTHLEEGYGSFHSRSVVMGGSAIRDAADNLRGTIRAAAGRYLNCAVGEVEIGAGIARGPGGRAIAWSDLAPLVADGEFLNTRHTYAFGAHAAHIAVDPRTGAVALIDYAAVQDAGRIVNPMTLNGQAVGAIVQGLGGAFQERMVYDRSGQLMTASLADYLLPAATDFANIRAVSLEDHPSPINPLGVKGAGEGGTIPVGGVIANALADALAATGAAPRALPLSPDRIWALIAEAGSLRQAETRAAAAAGKRISGDPNGSRTRVFSVKG